MRGELNLGMTSSFSLFQLPPKVLKTDLPTLQLTGQEVFITPRSEKHLGSVTLTISSWLFWNYFAHIPGYSISTSTAIMEMELKRPFIRRIVS